MLRRHLPRISLGTVYRNLEVLVRIGAIQKLETGGGEARFDGNPHEHQHVRCIRCGRVDDAELPLPNTVGLDTGHGGIKDVSGYAVLGIRLDLIGLCPGCRIHTDGSEDRLQLRDSIIGVGADEVGRATPSMGETGRMSEEDPQVTGETRNDRTSERGNV